MFKRSLIPLLLIFLLTGDNLGCDGLFRNDMNRNNNNLLLILLLFVIGDELLDCFCDRRRGGFLENRFTGRALNDCDDIDFLRARHNHFHDDIDIRRFHHCHDRHNLFDHHKHVFTPYVRSEFVSTLPYPPHPPYPPYPQNICNPQCGLGNYLPFATPNCIC